MTDDEVNTAIAALPGDKVTREQMEGRIVDTTFIRLGDTVTLCSLTLDNGYSVRGESACVDPANYNREIGEKLARDQAFNKLWPLFGFLLAEARHLAKVMAVLVMGLLLLPTLAHAQTADVIPDPIGLLTLLANAVPGAAAYLPAILAYLSLAGGICVLIVAFVPAPTTASPGWWLTLFRVINFVAGNFGHARNAVAPGMQPAVAAAALDAARVTAAAPEQAVIAGTVSVAKAVVLPMLLLAILSGCTAAQVTTTLAEGQLVCAVRTAAVAVRTDAGPVLAMGASKAAVDAVCGALQGVAISPPAGGVAGAVTIALPPSISIPVGR